MIIDSHCHAWTHWPYQPPVPDPGSRAVAEQLLFEMDTHGVDQALIVCAEIDHNPDNNHYIADVAQSHPDRLFQVFDVDSMWKTTYHQPGAVERLRIAARTWRAKGFTHYLKAEDDAHWLYSADGLAFFAAAAEHNLFGSLHCHPHQHAAIREVARRFPQLPILIHHLGHPRAGNNSHLSEILKSAECENIYIKTSGFYYATQQARWDYPYSDVLPIVYAIYQQFGAGRMCWGSDYPVARQFITYRQALEAFRSHCDFVSDIDKSEILGGTMYRLLNPTG
jgi:predicted TIM-barrel fold metal-dependent hydrolase